MSEEISREQAIEELSILLNKYQDSTTGDALNMAISALSAEPCEDAISRAEAQTEIMMFAGNCKSDEEDIYIKVSDAVQLLRDLPSVHAKPRTGQSKSIPSGIKLKIEREADYQNERVNADIARGMYLALEIIDKWEADNV